MIRNHFNTDLLQSDDGKFKKDGDAIAGVCCGFFFWSYFKDMVAPEIYDNLEAEYKHVPYIRNNYQCRGYFASEKDYTAHIRGDRITKHYNKIVYNCNVFKYLFCQHLNNKTIPTEIKLDIRQSQKENFERGWGLILSAGKAYYTAEQVLAKKQFPIFTNLFSKYDFAKYQLADN